MIGVFAASFVLITISSVSCCFSEKYTISEDKLNWIQAYTNCRQNHLHLVSISSKEQEDEIVKFINSCKTNDKPGKALWISLSKPGLNPSNSWRWFDTGKKLSESSYSNWAPGKPGNPAAKCAALTINDEKSLWNNFMCEKNHTLLYYVCEEREPNCD